MSGVGCRGGSRYVERYWGFPYLKIKKCIGFWFLVCFLFCGFIVLWFLVVGFYGFMVLLFYGSMVF